MGHTIAGTKERPVSHDVGGGAELFPAGYEPRQARYGRGWGGLTGPNKDVGAYSGIL